MKNLKIYYTSDVHGYIFPTDYLDREVKRVGYLSLLNKFKKDKNTLILDAGDMLQGSALDYYLEKEKDSKSLAKILNNANIDYYTLGNHDFNFGYDYLKDFIEENKAELVLSNVEDKAGNIKFKKSIIREMPNGLRVGIVGIVTDWIKLWEKKENILNFEITDPFVAAKEEYENIKDCDVKICLYHGGYEIDLSTLEKNSDTDENIGGKILKELSYDLLLTGHQHMKFEGAKIFNTYTVQSPANGTGALEIDIKKDDDLEIKSKIITPEEPSKIYENYSELDKKVQDFLDRPVAKLKKDYLPKDKLEMAIKGSELADFINKMIMNYTKCDISITSFANEISGLKKEVSIRDILNTYRFPNTLVVLEIDGKTLKEALEQNYSYVVYEDGKYSINKRFLDPKVEHYNFDFFYGVDFKIDFTKKVGERISSLKVKGRGVKEYELLSIAMNNYRKTGTGGFDMYKNLKILKSYETEISQILIEEISNIKEEV